MRGKLLVILMWVALPFAWSQQPIAAPSEPAFSEPCVAGARPSFDVVSVKPIDANSHSASVHGTPDGMMLSGALRRMILYAYALHEFQVTGGPDWIATSTWEVHGKDDKPEPDGSKLSAAQRKEQNDRRMQQVQSLLMDRFRLKCHMTTKELPIYELVVAKGGPKLSETTVDEAKGESTSVNGHGTQMHAKSTGVTTKAMVSLLGSEVDRLVVDKTGLTGRYDLTLDWVHDSPEASADMPSGPTLFTALEEQLGLKLQPAKGPVPVLVIDSAEKPGED
jgi:uncharacterized protein (TIGR03435 family)